MKFTFFKSISAIAAFGIARTSAQSTTAAATTAAASTAAAVSTDAAASTAAAASTSLTPTEGDCAMEVRMQEEGEVVAGVPGWNPEGNIIVRIAPEDCGVVSSDTWSVAGWSVTIVQIPPNGVFTPPALGADERQVIKIFRGSLIDVNYNGILKDDGHWHTYTVTTPNRAIPLFIDSDKTEITAGEDGAVISYWTVSEETLNSAATDMTASPVTDLSGPFMENLEWKITADLFGDLFDGVEFWNLAAINIQENDGSRLMNMQWWTFREDFNTDRYHNQHPDFGEIHMTMYAASGTTGMRTTLPSTENLNWVPNPDPTPANSVAYFERNQTEVQLVMPMPPGFAHGPLWSVDPSTGEPTLDCEGQAQYPMHGWYVDSVGPANDPLRYALWVAFEHPLDDVIVPTEMMTEWPNSNLQSTMTAAECELKKSRASDTSEASDADVETLSSSPTLQMSAFALAISFALVFWN